MAQVTVDKDPIVNLMARVPKSLKKRLERYKYSRSENLDRRATNDEIIIEAIDQHLKKFNY